MKFLQPFGSALHGVRSGFWRHRHAGGLAGQVPAGPGTGWISPDGRPVRRVRGCARKRAAARSPSWTAT